MTADWPDRIEQGEYRTDGAGLADFTRFIKGEPNTNYRIVAERIPDEDTDDLFTPSRRLRQNTQRNKDQ